MKYWTIFILSCSLTFGANQTKILFANQTTQDIYLHNDYLQNNTFKIAFGVYDTIISIDKDTDIVAYGNDILGILRQYEIGTHETTNSANLEQKKSMPKKTVEQNSLQPTIHEEEKENHPYNIYFTVGSSNKKIKNCMDKIPQENHIIYFFERKNAIVSCTVLPF